MEWDTEELKAVIEALRGLSNDLGGLMRLVSARPGVYGRPPADMTAKYRQIKEALRSEAKELKKVGNASFGRAWDAFYRPAVTQAACRLRAKVNSSAPEWLDGLYSANSDIRFFLDGAERTLAAEETEAAQAAGSERGRANDRDSESRRSLVQIQANRGKSVSETRVGKADVYRLLSEYNGLIVHFSNIAKGDVTNPNLFYPTDLLRVIARMEIRGSIPCSIVCPGDTLNTGRAVGCIGVILGLTDEKSIVTVSCDDCGSSWDGENERLTPEQHSITIEELRSSIIERRPNCYNEWDIANYEVLGILISSPYLAWRKDECCAKPESVAQIKQDFAGWPIYGFNQTSSGIVRVDLSDTTSVNHGEIYQIVE